MLFINKEPISAKDFAAKFNLPFNKIERAPEFEINKARKAAPKFGQSAEISYPVGTNFASHINVKFEGKSIEIRYANYTAMEPIVANSDKIVEKFYPPKVSYTGERMLVEEMDVDLALYLYVHPLNEFSPFRDQMKEHFHYSFNDKQMKGQKQVDTTMLETKAMQKVLTTGGDELRILAKGLGVAGVDDMEEITLQAHLITNYAKVNPQDFMDKTNSNKVIFKGLIVAAVDNGIIGTDTTNGRSRWIWKAGDKQGTEIVEYFDNGTPPVETLTNHIFSKINEYLPVLTTQHQKRKQSIISDEILDTMDKINLANIFGGSTDDISTGNSLAQTEEVYVNDVIADAKKQAGIQVEPVVNEEDDNKLDDDFDFLSGPPKDERTPQQKRADTIAAKAGK